MNEQFDKRIERRGSDSIKWRRYSEDVLPMWVADMDFAIAEPIQQALQQRLAHPVFGYAAVDSELTQAAVDWLQRRWGWQVELSHLVPLPAVVPGLNFAVQALEQPGKLAWPKPVYGPIAQVAANLGLSGGTFTIDANGWDLAELEQQLEDGVRTVLICCPQNPIGRTFSQQELEQFAALIERYDAYVVSDDIHGDLLFDGKRHLPLAKAVPAIADRVLTLFAAGKAFNIAGLPIGFAVVSNRRWRQQLKRRLNGFAPAPCVMSMTACKAAWQQGEPWLEQLLEVLQRNRDYLLAELDNEPKIEIVRPEATYLAWIDCRKLGWPQPAKTLEQYGLGVSDGAEFSMPGFVRLNFACPFEILVEGVARFKQALHAS